MHILESYEVRIWPTTFLPLINWIIANIDSLEESNSSPNGLIFVKATNAATKTHIAHYRISTRI